MAEYLPILIVGAIIGAFSLAFIIAYAALMRSKDANRTDRHMKDSELIKRLLRYAKPYGKDFIAVLLIMLLSIVYDVVSPALMGEGK